MFSSLFKEMFGLNLRGRLAYARMLKLYTRECERRENDPTAELGCCIIDTDENIKTLADEAAYLIFTYEGEIFVLLDEWVDEDENWAITVGNTSYSADELRKELKKLFRYSYYAED